MKNIIITGASGLIASELTVSLLTNSGYFLHLITSSPTLLKKRYISQQNFDVYTIEEFIEYTKHNGTHFDCLIHTAFARTSDGAELAKSLDYYSTILHIAQTIDLVSLINISSQSVYGLSNKPFWTEQTPCAPTYMYALGKYATEKMTELALNKTQINYTNIRLSSVCENARFLNVFVKNALSGEPITIMGGSQTCSFIDVRDVATALKCIIEDSNNTHFASVYNVGTNEKYSIESLAYLVKDIAKQKYQRDVSIQKESSNDSQDVGMDCSSFMDTFGWSPKYSINNMIISLFEYCQCIGNQHYI